MKQVPALNFTVPLIVSVFRGTTVLHQQEVLGERLERFSQTRRRCGTQESWPAPAAADFKTGCSWDAIPGSRPDRTSAAQSRIAFEVRGVRPTERSKTCLQVMEVSVTSTLIWKVPGTAISTTTSGLRP